MRFSEPVRIVKDGRAKTLAYMLFTNEHWRRICTNNTIDRLNREIHRRARAVGTVSDFNMISLITSSYLIEQCAP